MRYLTARKRAIGKGASHSGTQHHWYMSVSSVALAFLIPTFIVLVGSALGQERDVVLAMFARPFPAILTGMTLLVGMQHFQKGATMMIEDYTHGSTRRALIMAVIGLSWTITATGLFALAKIAF